MDGANNAIGYVERADDGDLVDMYDRMGIAFYDWTEQKVSLVRDQQLELVVGGW